MQTENTLFKEMPHRMARFCYWCSLLLLLAGMWILIDPYNRRTGARLHIYITLGSFEAYIWLLLILARWQESKALFIDTARSGIFSVVLVGLQFLTLNELYMTEAGESYVISSLMLILAIAKLIKARRWLGVELTRPILLLCCMWLVMLALPAPIFYVLKGAKSTQHGVGYLLCWWVALLVAGHLALVGWQKRKGWQVGGQVLQKWWGGWVLLGVLAALNVIQLYATMWGLYVNWSQWYFSPIFIAAAVIMLSLSYARGVRGQEAWVFLVFSILHIVFTSHGSIPREFPVAWSRGIGAYLVHPIYPSGALMSLLFGMAGWVLDCRWFYGLALLAPVAGGIFKITKAMWNWRSGKGVALVIAAFVFLGAGAALQAWQVRWGHKKSKKIITPPDLPDKTD